MHVERAFEPQEIFSVFFSFNGIKKHVISPPLPRILSVLSRSASVSYAGSSGSDTMPMICDLHFVKIFIRVCNLEKVTFEQKYSVHLSHYGPCKANLHSQMYEGKALCI